MPQITTLAQIPQALKTKSKKTVAVAWALDDHSLEAVNKLVEQDLAKAILVGEREKILCTLGELKIDAARFTIEHASDALSAAKRAVELVRTNTAHVLMKGLVGTDVYLKAVLDKQNGLLPEGKIMSHVTVAEIPAYEKLLILTDVAVLPFPTLEQKIAMLNYAVKIAKALGIEKPKAALLAAVEKVNLKMPATTDAAQICKMAERCQIRDVIVDGPVDVFLACDPAASAVKGVATPLNGESDILLFPDIECANMFYKGLMLFGKGEIAALIQGTGKPVVVTSRSESIMSKYYSMALGCLLAEDE